MDTAGPLAKGFVARQNLSPQVRREELLRRKAATDRARECYSRESVKSTWDFPYVPGAKKAPASTLPYRRRRGRIGWAFLLFGRDADDGLNRCAAIAGFPYRRCKQHRLPLASCDGDALDVRRSDARAPLADLLCRSGRNALNSASRSRSRCCSAELWLCFSKRAAFSVLSRKSASRRDNKASVRSYCWTIVKPP